MWTPAHRCSHALRALWILSCHPHWKQTLREICRIYNQKRTIWKKLKMNSHWDKRDNWAPVTYSDLGTELTLCRLTYFKFEVSVFISIRGEDPVNVLSQEEEQIRVYNVFVVSCHYENWQLTHSWCVATTKSHFTKGDKKKCQCQSKHFSFHIVV